MNQRDKDLAAQAWTANYWKGYVDLAKFAALTRADEREQIAKLVDALMGLHNSISEAIRARGNT